MFGERTIASVYATMANRVCDLLQLTGADSDVGVFSSGDLPDTGLTTAIAALPAVLVYGLATSSAQRAQFHEVIGHELPVVVPPDAPSELMWTTYAGALAPQLAGLRVFLAGTRSFSCFGLDAIANRPGVEPLAMLNGQPWFLRVAAGQRWTYLLGIDDVPDPQTVVASADQEQGLVSAAAAILLFVRKHFAGHAWFPGEAFANFVIDDPLLRPTYGYVTHDELAARVSAKRSAATVAFIPWNARRTRERTAALYRRAHGLSICVHGYEHIQDEFATNDMDELHWRALAAMHAMQLHRELTGVPYEKVMVFPQGRFSPQAVAALSRAGFLAAANSTFIALGSAGVPLRDLLEPAVMSYGPMPLLRRRATAYLNRFRYDVVLGKPLLMVEHHEYFRDRGLGFEQAVDDVRAIAPGVRWTPLGEIARRVHLRRTSHAGHTDVKFYCREFTFTAAHEGTYEFVKREDTSDVESVIFDGHPIQFAMDRENLRFGAICEPGEHHVHVLGKECPPTRTRGPHGRRWSVAARRYLSEGRDNYVVGNRPLQACAALVRRLVTPTRVCRATEQADQE